MKNTFKIIILAVVAMAALASCQYKSDFTTQPYVYPANSTLSIPEDTSTQFAVIAAVPSETSANTQVTFEIEDGTAENGVDFTVEPTSGVLDFSTGSTQYITIKPVDRSGEITGDMDFTVRLLSATNGYDIVDSTAVVTIIDADVTWSYVTKGDYTYSIFWEGEDPGLELYKNDATDNEYKIEHWGYDVDFVFTWDEETNEVYVKDQNTGYYYSYYGEDVYVDEIDDWAGGFSAQSYYEDGVFYFCVIYYISLGYFNYGYETYVLDGYSLADYSIDVSYAGKFTEAGGNNKAVGKVVLGEDVAYADVALVTSDELDEALDSLAAGGEYDYLGFETITESSNVAFDCNEDGKYSIIAVSYSEKDEAKQTGYATFNFTLGESYTPSIEDLVGWYIVSGTSYFGSSYDTVEYWVIDYSDSPYYDIMLTVFDGWLCDYPIYGYFDDETGEFAFYGWQYFKNYSNYYDLWFSSYYYYYVTFTLTAEGAFGDPDDLFGTYLCDYDYTEDDYEYYLGWSTLYTDASGTRIDPDPSLESTASVKTASVKGNAKTMEKPSNLTTDRADISLNRRIEMGSHVFAPAAKVSAKTTVTGKEVREDLTIKTGNIR